LYVASPVQLPALLVRQASELCAFQFIYLRAYRKNMIMVNFSLYQHRGILT